MSNPEYVDDVPYVRHFIADLAPSRLRLAAALNGVTPPPASDFDYCELGCAHGDTLVALAAANPESRFLGIDINAEHVATAKKLARDGAVENVGVLERDYESLLEEDVGDFDYIVAHGVLSWVSPEKRAALIAFARRKLKPGGLLHVSYNAMPGWASVEPVRQLLLFGGGDAKGLDRAQRGFAFALAMKNAGAKYFSENPAAVEMLSTMDRAGLPYVVHEYMHDHWAPMYFARVAFEMAQGDLHFVGCLPLHGNFRDTAITEEQEKLLASVTDRLTFESLKDFATNEFLRRDIFVRGAVPRTPAAADAFLDATTWTTLSSAIPGERSVKLPNRTLSFEGPAFDMLLGALASREVRLEEVQLRSALMRLILVEHALPMRFSASSDSSTGAGTFTGSAAYAIPSAYNMAMLRRRSPEAPLVLASDRLGTAIPMAALEGVALRALTESADPSAWIDTLLSTKVVRIRVGERVLEDVAEQRTALVTTLDQLRQHRLPKLIEHGIVSSRD